MNPLLGRWISADPLAVHGGGADLNVYASVSGCVLKSIDPVGLEGGDVDDPDTGEDASGGGDDVQFVAYSASSGGNGDGNAYDPGGEEDAGTGHTGAPSEGSVGQGQAEVTITFGEVIMEELPGPAQDVLKGAGRVAEVVYPPTGDTACQGGDCARRDEFGKLLVLRAGAVGGGLGAVTLNRTVSGVLDDMTRTVNSVDVGMKMPEPPGGMTLHKFERPQSLAETGWREGDYFMRLPDQGSEMGNWGHLSFRTFTAGEEPKLQVQIA